jgi:UPF0755 protein
MAADVNAADKKRSEAQAGKLSPPPLPAGHVGAAKKAGSQATRTNPTLSPAQALEPKRMNAKAKAQKKIKEPRTEVRSLRAVSSLFTALALLTASVGVMGYLLLAQFEADGPVGAARTFIVPKGEGRIDIAARLERDGLITSRWAFVAGHMLLATSGQRRSVELKAGSYEIKPGSSMRDIVDMLVDGKTVAGKITIPEGLTSQQIVERIKADTNLSGEVTTIPAEGTLMPDTYIYNRGMARQDLLDRMVAKQAEVLAAAWEKRQQGLPFQTPQQALVMASIIEKETGRNDERERVAAVFVNRLRKNMRLQSDPTIIYGITGGQGPLGRPITRSDIDTKTAYNTYQIDGLPPTPIANAGRLAIEATLNPAQTNEIYFVADGTGGHTFSETLKDHNTAVANWRKVERDAKAARAVVTPPAAPVIVNQANALAAPPSKVGGPKMISTGPAPGVAPGAANAIPLPASDPNSPEPPAAVLAAEPALDVPLPVRKPKR